MINGKHPNKLMDIHDKPTITKPSLAKIFVFLTLKNDIRKPINTKLAPGITNEIMFIKGSL